jgi:hypothetical protein
VYTGLTRSETLGEGGKENEVATTGDAAFVTYLNSIMNDPELSLGAKHAAIRRALATRGGDTARYQHYLRTLEQQMGAGQAAPPRSGAPFSGA